MFLLGPSLLGGFVFETLCQAAGFLVCFGFGVFVFVLLMFLPMHRLKKDWPRLFKKTGLA